MASGPFGLLAFSWSVWRRR
ncbi:MAG: hypothetical protein IJ919_09820 [Sphingopyxis sp.]|nr:hypothetical protein [Sphingopyxis sp.]